MSCPETVAGVLDAFACDGLSSAIAFVWKAYFGRQTWQAPRFPFSATFSSQKPDWRRILFTGQFSAKGAVREASIRGEPNVRRTALR